MSTPLHMKYRGLDPSEAVNAKVQELLDQFDAHVPRWPIKGCTVTIELENHRAGKAAEYGVIVELAIKGEVLVVTRQPSSRADERRPAPPKLYALLHEAFDALTRQFIETVQRHRHEVKHHERAVASTVEAEPEASMS